ncbi:hypothetical protein F5Y09DRAFT_340451 [Xylaria sp. FL1042]|nr:hypothetical protein F5Y09DRAFT_340451 [Xylaria sp. FL1042]
MASTLPLLLLLAGSLSVTSSQEVLDLGSLDQYDGKLGDLPSLTGSVVWLSGSDSEDYNVVLSSDTQNKVQGVLEGCGDTVDDRCWQDVCNVLRESELQLDDKLDRRHFGHLLSKTFTGGVALFYEYVTSILTTLWSLKHADETFAQKFLPRPQVSAATIFATATNIVISAEGQAVATVTPTPVPTSIQGSQIPSVTAVTSAHDAFATGDLAAVLDANLASRLDEIMHRLTDCDDGRDFDAGSISRKRANPSYGNAICAVEGAVAMVQPGGALNDLLLLDPSRLHFNFAGVAGEVSRAAGVAVGFVQAYAPLLSISDDLSIQLGNYLFALALDTLIDNLPLSGENRIASSLVTTATTTPTSTATSTSTGCPDPTSSPLVCGFSDEDDDCDVQLPQQPDDEPRCKSGDNTGCICNAPSDIIIDIAENEEQQAILLISSLLSGRESQPDPSAQCDTNNLSDIPGNIFDGPQNNVYHHFCDKWVAGTELTMTVDASGNNKDPEGQLRSLRRTPPPNPGVYTHYNINLGFKPSDGDKKCIKECVDAFSQIGDACRNTGAQDQLMQSSGSLDVGCGVFDYNIVETTPLEVQEQQCYGADDFGPHGDIHESQVNQLSLRTCIILPSTIKRGDSSTNVAIPGDDNGQPVQMNVYWKDGCILDYPSPDEMSPGIGLVGLDLGYLYKGVDSTPTTLAPPLPNSPDPIYQTPGPEKKSPTIKMKFLAIPTLFAASAQALLGIAFTNDIPVDGNYTIGTDFVLTWKAYDATAADTLQISLSAWNKTISGYSPGPFGSQIPIYDTREIVLAESVPFLDESYTWHIEPINGDAAWSGQEFYYSFTAHFPNTWDSPRAFHIVD